MVDACEKKPYLIVTRPPGEQKVHRAARRRDGHQGGEFRRCGPPLGLLQRMRRYMIHPGRDRWNEIAVGGGYSEALLPAIAIADSVVNRASAMGGGAVYKALYKSA